jgi:hypothetical protein
METVILVIIGIAVLGFIIWRLVKSSRSPCCDCGGGSKKNNYCSACHMKESIENNPHKSME